MSVTFAVKAHTFSLYKAIKEEAEKLGWIYYDDFMGFEEENMQRCNCLYFSNEWPDFSNEHMFSFSNHESKDKRFYLPGDWNTVIDHLKELNPAKGAVNYNMKDPNLQAPGTQDQEAIKQQAEQAEVAQESAPQDQAAPQDSEEGTTEG